jgi:glycerol-3-phosphate acyltransferase PlsY
MVFNLIIVAVIGYLLGSIPCGLIAAKLTGGADVRKIGSGKTGATNVLRGGGKKAALLTVIGDLAKGAVAVIIAMLLVGSQELSWGSLTLDVHIAQVIAGLTAVVGHNWSVFIKFQGGRGITTFFGALLAIYYPVALGCGGVIVVGVALLTRYASLGSISGAIFSFLIMLALVLLINMPAEYLIYTGVGMGLIIFRHRDNIQRLRAGTERKLGEKGELSPSQISGIANSSPNN